MRYFKLPAVVALGAILAFFGGAQMAVAQPCTPTTNLGCGDQVVNGCMDNLFDTPAGGELNCTANDVRVSGVADVGTTELDGSCSPGPDGLLDECDITFAPVCDAGADNPGDDCSNDPNICKLDGEDASDLCGDRCAFEGDTTNFAATFEVLLSAQGRFDIGLYFAVDGDSNGDGALTGTCWIGTLPEDGTFTRPDITTGNFVDLDLTCKGGDCPQPQDLCGDIDDGSNPIFYDLAANNFFIEAVCIANENGKLNLPNCTSWRQSGANEVCEDPTDAFPGSPSKCNCQPEFEVPIEVPPAELQVVKTVSTDTTFHDSVDINEPGGTVTFRVEVTNTGIDPNNDVTLNSLNDDIWGNLDADSASPAWDSSTCLDDDDGAVIIKSGSTYTCHFTATLINKNGGDSETDTVTAMGVDDNGNSISGTDDATVNILDVLPAISVDKTASPTSVEEPGADVVYTVVVDNDSSVDVLTVTSLNDVPYGNITTTGHDNIIDTTCSVPRDIEIGSSYSCWFKVYVEGNGGDPAVGDEVTATGEDDEENVVTASDTASVSITDVGASIQLIKTVSTDGENFSDTVHISEPGQEVIFKLQVNNTSPVDYLTITDLTEIRPYIEGTSGTETDILDICLDDGGNSLFDRTIAPGGSLTCTFALAVEGEPRTENDLAKVCADDDDTNVTNWCIDDMATVIIDDEAPAASLTKTVTQMIVTYVVTVYNDSDYEALTIDSLLDNRFNDITTTGHDGIISTTCDLIKGDSIPIGGYLTCTFDATVDSSPHADKVTGTVSDNEGSSVYPFDCAEVTFGEPGSCTSSP